MSGKIWDQIGLFGQIYAKERGGVLKEYMLLSLHLGKLCTCKCIHLKDGFTTDCGKVFWECESHSLKFLI